ncbi:hypothetical protein [Amycolatopsis sp. DG1A-15b]|uniref:hypothetical protein n=1 Tax=Amycolatopsis sp. DG1A-15b TaxID=3052846 RepID=UPI00255BF6D9|nr:hypothetical protein [Amycolatopsis sp. DG1A-15b]WIX87953.1 hypothetical protein QRY02_43605 [Amycolatopsis sp. DG1A-15b]
MIAAVAAATALATAGVFVLGDGAGTTDGIVTAIHPDGRVEWTDARFVKAEENGSNAEPVPGTAHKAVLAGDVEIFTGVGRWCASAAAGLAVGLDGTGSNPCTRAEFLATTPDSLYAVKITAKGDVVTRIAEYYHP